MILNFTSVSLIEFYLLVWQENSLLFLHNYWFEKEYVPTHALFHFFKNLFGLRSPAFFFCVCFNHLRKWNYFTVLNYYSFLVPLQTWHTHSYRPCSCPPGGTCGGGRLCTGYGESCPRHRNPQTLPCTRTDEPSWWTFWRSQRNCNVQNGW